jgi:hypothetical protein
VARLAEEFVDRLSQPTRTAGALDAVGRRRKVDPAVRPDPAAAILLIAQRSPRWQVTWAHRRTSTLRLAAN